MLENGDTISIRPYELRFCLVVSDTPPGTQPFGTPTAASDTESDAATVVAPEPPAGSAFGTPSLLTLRVARATGLTFSETFSFAAHATVRIGRSPDSDVCLDLPTVSRRHAEIRNDGGDQWHIRRVSQNSWLKVNGREVDECTLGGGDEIAIGPDVTLVAGVTAPEDHALD